MIKQVVRLLFALAFTLTQGQEVVKASQIEEATKLLQELQTAQNIPSVSVAVGRKGSLIWSEAMGLADRRNEIKATTATKYRVGSIGKTMTALALAKLYDEGTLKFDQDIRPLVPQLNTLGYPLTIRQIAGHQGGIRHYRGFEFFSKKQYDSVTESLEIFINDPIEFEPGTKYSYSTYGYVLLSRIIELVAERDFLDYMSKEVFEPLQMQHTVAENAGKDESNSAKFYSPNGKREVRSVNLSNKWGGGGFLSTPSDLVAMINNSHEIIDVQTLFELATPQKLPNGETTGYGMGFRISEVQSTGRLLFHHGGKSAGARAFLLVLPAEQVVVAVCTNSMSDFGVTEMYQIAKLFIN